ncbi:MAG: DNA-3-methyladenine glycosylase 2 family protein [Pseudomonadota bacterium]
MAADEVGGAVPLDAARLEAGLQALAARDPDIARALTRVGLPEPRVQPPGFSTLLRIIVGQQVSTKAAAAIWGRLEQGLGEVTPAALLAMSDEAVRACGLSRPKLAYAKGLAEAVVDGRLDIAGLERADDEAALAAITALKGFGRWSAEIYLLFALGRADTWPAGDLGVRLGLMRLKGLAERPTDAQMAEHGERWRPHRGCAAIFLWKVYGSTTLESTAES